MLNFKADKLLFCISLTHLIGFKLKHMTLSQKYKNTFRLEIVREDFMFAGQNNSSDDIIIGTRVE